jgi:hypothetical protein
MSVIVVGAGMIRRWNKIDEELVVFVVWFANVNQQIVKIITD